MAFTETWPGLGAITSGQDNTWTNAAGSFQVESAAGSQWAVEQTLNDYAFARCETALASADHSITAPFRYNGQTPNDNLLCLVCVRFAAAANTCIAAGYWAAGAGGAGNIRLITNVAGSQTVIGDASHANPAQDTTYELRLQVVGDEIKVYLDGVLKLTVNDSTITTGVRIGIGGYQNQADTNIFGTILASEVGLDHFTIEAADGVPLRSQKQGVAFDVVITARDAGGSVVTDFADTVDVSAAGATLSSGSGTTGAFTAGVLTRSLTFSTLGAAVVVSVEDTDTGLVTGDSAEFAVWDLEAVAVSATRNDLDWSDHAPSTGVQIHRSEVDDFVPSDDPPETADELAVDWGYDLDGSATDPGKDELITLRHLAHMMSGYGRVQGAGEAWSYGDIPAGLYGDLIKRFYGASFTGIDSNEILNDVAVQLFAPLQFQDDPDSILTTRQFRGTEMTPRGLAKIGLLVLNKGNWNGQRILPRSIFGTFGAPGSKLGEAVVPIDAASDEGADANANYVGFTPFGVGGENQTTTGPGMFGWMWWVNYQHGETGEKPWPHLPDDTIMLDGAYGQNVLIVIPSLHMVVAFQGNAGDSRSLSEDSTWNQNLKLLTDAVTGAGSLSPIFPTGDWDDESYANAGLDEATLEDFETNVGGRGIVTRYGYRIHTWGTQTGRSDWASAGKGILSLLALNAIANYTLIGTVGDGVTSYQDETGLQLGAEYHYRVVPTDGGGPIFESNEVSVTVTEGQTALPASVVSRGNWTDTNDSTDNADIVAAVQTASLPDAKSPGNPTTGDVLKYKLEELLTANGLLIEFGLRKIEQGLGRTVNLTVELRSPDGSVLLDSWVHTNLGLSNDVIQEDISALELSGEHEVWLVPSTS